MFINFIFINFLIENILNRKTNDVNVMMFNNEINALIEISWQNLMPYMIGKYYT